MEQRPRFAALVGLLEPDLRLGTLECWDIGEQEAALDNLVRGLLAAGTVVPGADRARIAVLAEQWGHWDSVRPRLAECSAPEDDLLVVVEGTEEETSLALDEGVVAWIRCRGCGDTIFRTHEVEPWGPSFNAASYEITRADGSRVSFADSLAALDTLLAWSSECQ